MMSTRCDLLRISHKNWAYKNLCYLAIISVLNQPVIHSSYQNLTMSNSVARNRTLKCKKAPSNVRKGPFNIKSKNTMVFNKMPKSKFKSNYKPPQRFCTYFLYLSEYFPKSYICSTTRPFLIRKKCVLKPV